MKITRMHGSTIKVTVRILNVDEERKNKVTREKKITRVRGKVITRHEAK